MAGTEHVDCIIAGGGPAGIVAGLLLARGGVRVVVLEKHEDFFRDFRGDTIHPSTLRLLDELGLYHEFARITHRRVTGVSLVGRDGRDVVLADLSRLRVPQPFMTIAPQWDFLDLLARAGEKEPCFDLRMGAEMTSLVHDGDRVVGVRAHGPSGDFELRAPLVVAADGRWSKAREQAGLPVRELHSGIDVWWFRVNTSAQISDEIAPRAGHGSVFVAIPRDGHVQIARLNSKGEDAQFRARGVAELRSAVAETYPALAEDVHTIHFDDVKLLDVRRNEGVRWYAPGLLCIGDSAHAMSPLGGVGVNLAVQDGVATRVPAFTVIPARILGMGITPEHAPDFARRPESTLPGTAFQRQ